MFSILIALVNVICIWNSFLLLWNDCRILRRMWLSESEVAQSSLTLCDPMDWSLPGSSVHGIFQARVLEWVSISNPGIEPRSPTLQADALPSEPAGKPHTGLLSCIWILIPQPEVKPSACMLSHFSHVQLFVNPWTVVRLAPLSLGFSRQEYWSGLPCPPPGHLPDPGINLLYPLHWQVVLYHWATWEAPSSLHWEHTILGTGPPGKSLTIAIY